MAAAVISQSDSPDQVDEEELHSVVKQGAEAARKALETEVFDTGSGAILFRHTPAPGTYHASGFAIEVTVKLPHGDPMKLWVRLPFTEQITRVQEDVITSEYILNDLEYRVEGVDALSSDVREKFLGLLKSARMVINWSRRGK